MGREQIENRSEAVAKAVDQYTATTIPVHVDVDMKQAVLNLEEAERLLCMAETIALGPCGCRKEKGDCDLPLDVCLTLDEDSDLAAEEWEGFRHVSVDEALAALRVSHEAGLVHLVYRKPGVEATIFCSCCSCCCWFLNALKQYDYHDAIVESSHVAEHDVTACVACEACVARCPFDAWSAVANGGKPVLNPEKCFGCGLCTSSCPSGVISLVPRPASEPTR
jgi:Pyruvate/2-oxoacid:ferredoxin oxidoreductase delta subunit